LDGEERKLFFGYKDHIKIDGRNKLIDTYEVTSAEVHDSQGIDGLLREEDKGQELYADSAYVGQGV
jgi:IS5 family transposase